MILSSRYLLLIALIGLFPLSQCKRRNCKRNIEEKVYVANEDDGTVTVFDAENYEILKTVKLDDRNDMFMPHNIQAAPDNRSVWIAAPNMHHGEGEDRVIVLKFKRDKPKEEIDVGNEQHLAHVVLDDASENAFVTATELGEVIKIDAKEYKETERFNLGSGSEPHGLRYMNGKLYVACMGTKELAIVDASNGSVSHVPLGGIAVQTAVLPGPNCVYVSVYDLKEVVRYDVTTGDTIRIPLPAGSQGPIQLYPSPDNQRVYVCDQGIVNGNPSSNKLYVINTGTNTVTGTITVGNGAHGVVTNGDGTKIFVTNLSDNTVSVVDARTLQVVALVHVGTKPNGISVLECECR